MALKIFIRQGAVFTATGSQIWYTGASPTTLATSPTLPASRQWSGYPNYIEITNETNNIQDLDLTFTLNQSRDGTKSDSVEQKKAASGSLQVEGDAYLLIKSWLIDDVSASLNLVDVKIVDENCGVYDDFCIKSGDVEYCEPTIASSLCQLSVTLKQRDSPLTCIQNTLISDNWQGWFQEIPANGKMHPRISYCNEIRPNFQLCLLWTMMVIFAFILQIFLLVLFPIIIILLAIIYAIVVIVNFVIKLVSSKDLDQQEQDLKNYINTFTNLVFGGFLDNWSIALVETAGCGREHPSVLVRDYITNVCDKCGISVDHVTAPVYFSTSFAIETSDTQVGTNGYTSINNPYYNLTALYAEVERGIRRWENVSLLGKSNPNVTQFFIPANSPIVTLSDFLDRLNTVFNTDWRVRYVNVNGQLTPYLFIQRKDWFLTTPGDYLYDFTTNSPDRSKLIEGVCFTWNGEKNPAFVTGLYSPDAADTCGNEAKKYYNNHYSFADVSQNPNFDGELNKTSPYFSPAKFRLDGTSTDYIMDAYSVTGISTGIFNAILGGAIFRNLLEELTRVADYALQLRDETATLPKLIIWDGKSYLNAKATKDYYATSQNANTNSGFYPVPNTVYNNPAQEWRVKHRPATNVLGSFIGFLINNGTYATGLGNFIFPAYIRPAVLVNYPMYFEPYYRDNIWDIFQWIDDPVRNPKINMDWKCKIELCCEDLQHIKVYDNAADIKLLYKVKLPQVYQQDGILRQVRVSYKNDDKQGKFIELSGTL